MTKETYGCHTEIDNVGYGTVYADCVLETGVPKDCDHSRGLERKEDCPVLENVKNGKDKLRHGGSNEESRYKWIRQNVPENCIGQCAEITTAMLVAFPELRRVRGHLYDPLWGRRQHWWLVTSTDEIIDPTASQFPGRGSGEYCEWDEGKPEPTGKCLNCGDYCFDNKVVCSPGCEAEVMVDYCAWT